MKLFDFGNTHLKVSKIGLGLAALGRPGYINIGHNSDLNGKTDLNSMELHSGKMLDLAYLHGVRYFDLARSYGKAENFFKNWQEKNQEYLNVVVGSKWGYEYTGDWKVDASIHEVKVHSLAQLDKQWIESLEIMNRKPDIYHIHSATIDSGVLQNQKIIDRLWELRENGVIIGLSSTGYEQKNTIEMALGLKKGNDQLFQSIQVTFNVLEQSTEEILKYASNAGCGIIVKEILANGRLSKRNTEPGLQDKINIIDQIASKYNVAIYAICMAYAMQNNWSSVVLSGASTEEQLLSNINATKIQLTNSEITQLQNIQEQPKEYWRKRSELIWN